MEALTLRRATVADLDTVEDLYRDAVGREGCIWNESYPTRADAENDVASGCLFLALRGGKVIGCASVVPENELDDLPFWQKRGDVREIARVTVAKTESGHGYAAELLRLLFRTLSDGGCRAIRLLVAKCNPAAIAIYRKLGFSFLGSVAMYGNDYFACELALSET